MVDPWIMALGAVVVGLLSGVVGAALVRRALIKGRENKPEIVDAARRDGDLRVPVLRGDRGGGRGRRL